jgi:hypothetical protein
VATVGSSVAFYRLSLSGNEMTGLPLMTIGWPAARLISAGVAWLSAEMAVNLGVAESHSADSTVGDSDV